MKAKRNLSVVMAASLLLLAGSAATANTAPPKKPVPAKIEKPGPLREATEKLGKLTRGQKSSVQVRDKWALIVGLESFSDNSIRPVKFAQENAVLLSTYCASPEAGKFGPGHVVIVTNNKASKSNIEAALGDTWLLKNALPNDIVLLYFATRAELSKDGSDVLLYMFDAPSSAPELGSIELKSMLKTLRQRTQSKQILCVLDLNPVNTGKSDDESGGSDEPATTPTVDKLQEIAQETGTTIISAAAIGRRSHADFNNRCSFFMESLLEALSNNNGQDKFESVAQAAAQKTQEKVFQTIKKKQAPQIASADSALMLQSVLAVPVKSGTPEKPLRIGHPIEKLKASPARVSPDSANKTQAIADKHGVEANKHEADEEPTYDDNASFGNVDFGPYMDKMKKHIQSQWKPPKSTNAQRVVTVFSIKKDGTIANAQIVDGSGDENVDQSAMEALNKASPLEPLPEGSPPYVQIRYQFDWAVKKN